MPDDDKKNTKDGKPAGVIAKPSFLSGSASSDTNTTSNVPPRPPVPPNSTNPIPNPPSPGPSLTPSNLPPMPPAPGVSPIPSMPPTPGGASSMPVGLPPPPIIITAPVVDEIPSDLDRAFPLPKKSTPGFTDDSVLNYPPSDSFLRDLQIYFYQLYRAFNLRFDMWEETSINMLKVLRAMNANVEKNTAVMITYIEYLEKRILTALEKFKHKRNEVIRYANVDYENIIKEFRRTIGLLGLQLRDIHLRQTVDRFATVYLK